MPRICRTFIFVATTNSHIARYCFITECTLRPSQRDCFALISQLNIQSLRYARLARAILSQPCKSKQYLCPCAIRVTTIFPPPSRSMLSHWVMKHIPRRDVSRMIPDGNAESSAFFEAQFHLHHFYAVLEVAFRRASQCTSSILFETSYPVLFPAASRLSQDRRRFYSAALLLFAITSLSIMFVNYDRQNQFQMCLRHTISSLPYFTEMCFYICSNRMS